MSEPRKLHSCEGDLPHEGDRPAISCCDESDDGSLWVTGPDGSSQVGYCPYCGFEARNIPTLLLFRKIGIDLT